VDIKKLKKYLDTFKKGINKLSPPLSVGGLHITDTALTYLKIKGDSFDKVTLRLPPGIVEGGRIKDKKRFISTLQEFRKTILPGSGDRIFVVLSLPSNLVHIQPVSLPVTSGVNQFESTILNLQMVSPIDAENAYFGWQDINIGRSDNLRNEVLGAFVLRNVVDDIFEALNIVDIYAISVEFSSLSLARAIERGIVIEKDKPYILVEINVEGVQFAVIRGGVPFFHASHSWKDIQRDKKNIPTGAFRALLSDELHRILNFYASRWGDQPINDLIVITSALTNEIEEAVKKDFGFLSLHVHDPSVLSVVSGSAIRGASHELFKDNISLSNFSDSGTLSREISSNFVRIWRDLYVSVLGFFLAVFLGLDIFIAMAGGTIIKNSVDISNNPNLIKLAVYEREAMEFNLLVQKIEQVRINKQKISPILARLRTIAGDNIDLTRFSYISPDSPIVLSGTAISDSVAIAFKNRLVDVPQFTNVDLPLTAVSTQGDRTVFRLEFNVASFDL